VVRNIAAAGGSIANLGGTVALKPPWWRGTCPSTVSCPAPSTAAWVSDRCRRVQPGSAAASIKTVLGFTARR